MKELLQNIIKVSKVSFLQFIYYNFLCKKVHREKHAYLIPYRGSVIKLRKGSALYLNGNLLINTGRMWGVSENCYLLLGPNAVLKISKRTHITYSCRVVLGPDANMEIGSMGCNTGCEIVCLNSITMGYNVMIGWDVTIVDGDGHPVGYGENEKKETTKPVIIGNHVWLCSGSHIMKGSKIGDGAIIGAKSFITGRVKPGAMTSPMPAKVIMQNVGWDYES